MFQFLFLRLALFLALLSPTLATPTQSPLPYHDFRNQSPLSAREKVPGDNPAYFTRVPERYQLFTVHEFTISPYPPKLNHRIFFYLNGHTYNYSDLPGLANATLELRINPSDKDSDEDHYFFKRKISKFRLFTVRDEMEYTYGGPFLPGPNELVGDFFMLDVDPEPGSAVWDIEVVGRLPDNKILFAFEARVEINNYSSSMSPLRMD